jgi:uncharacterized protein YoxC
MEDSTMKMHNRRLTLIEGIKIGELLKKHCMKLPDGFAKYEEGWNDKRVAETVSPSIRTLSVGTLRQDMYGKLHTGGAENFRPNNERFEEVHTKIRDVRNTIHTFEMNIAGSINNHRDCINRHEILINEIKKSQESTSDALVSMIAKLEDRVNDIASKLNTLTQELKQHKEIQWKNLDFMESAAIISTLTGKPK